MARSGEQFDFAETGDISSASANGHAVTLAKGANETLSQTDVLAVWVYLVELFDRAASALGVDVTDLSVHAQIKTQMETYLRPVCGYTTNFAYILK